MLGIPASQESENTRHYIHEVGKVLTAHNTGHLLEAFLAVQLDCGIMGDPVEIVMVIDDRTGECVILQLSLCTECSGGIFTDPAQQRLDLAAHLTGMGAAGAFHNHLVGQNVEALAAMDLTDTGVACTVL